MKKSILDHIKNAMDELLYVTSRNRWTVYLTIIIIAILFNFYSCIKEEPVQPINKIECKHEVLWNEETQRIEITIESELPYVDIYRGERLLRVAKAHYRCISLVKLGNSVKIIAEETCEYII